MEVRSLVMTAELNPVQLQELVSLESYLEQGTVVRSSVLMAELNPVHYQELVLSVKK